VSSAYVRQFFTKNIIPQVKQTPKPHIAPCDILLFPKPKMYFDDLAHPHDRVALSASRAVKSRCLEPNTFVSFDDMHYTRNDGVGFYS
jgi:hypothetical protein